MTLAETTKHSVGRPRVRIKPEDVNRLRSQGATWRQIAKTLRIGTATAMRLFKLSEGTCPKIHPMRPKTPDVEELDLSLVTSECNKETSAN